jgi:hypothetical protein
MPVEAPKMTRQERLNAQRDAFLEWAKTATTDEIPGDLGVEATPPAS